MKTIPLNSFLKFYVMISTQVDLYGIAHVKVDIFPHQKMHVIPMLGRFVWTTTFVQCEGKYVLCNAWKVSRIQKLISAVLTFVFKTKPKQRRKLFLKTWKINEILTFNESLKYHCFEDGYIFYHLRRNFEIWNRIRKVIT